MDALWLTISTYLNCALSEQIAKPIRDLKKHSAPITNEILVSISSCVMPYTHPVTSALSKFLSATDTNLNPFITVNNMYIWIFRVMTK